METKQKIKGFINILAIIAIGATMILSSAFYVSHKTNQVVEKANEEALGATISTTELSDTIGTFRTNVNTSLTNLNAAISNTTSSLGNIASFASTTGNLIVGSSTEWRAMVVGSNGKILTASSTAVGGLSWETNISGSVYVSTSSPFSAGYIPFATSSSAITNSNIFQSGSNISIGNYNLTGINNLTATSATIGTINITALAESPLIIGGTATTTIYGNGSESTFGGGISATYASSSNANFVNTTTTNLFFRDNTKQTTAFKDIGFNVLNATTTATATTTIQKLFYGAITLTQVDCQTNGANATIGMDIRASSTPETAGTTIASSMVCDSNGFSTSTFSNSNLSLQLLNTDIKSLANSTTSIRVFIKYKEQ